MQLPNGTFQLGSIETNWRNTQTLCVYCGTSTLEKSVILHVLIVGSLHVCKEHVHFVIFSLVGTAQIEATRSANTP